MSLEKAKASDTLTSGLVAGTKSTEQASATGRFVIECFDKDGKLKWEDTIKNAVCTEGKNAALTHFLKGSSYTSTVFMGLIEDASYGYAGANGSGVAATNLANSLERRITKQGVATASALSLCRAIRTASVLVPRSTSHASIGPGTAPDDFRTKAISSANASSLTTSIPPMTSEWPFRYFVVECITTSAPSSNGFWL